MNDKKIEKKEPTLVVMAAGVGSRYGGLKQLDAMTEQDEVIFDFSLYDALRAGFKRAIFIVRDETLQLFKDHIKDRAEKSMTIEFVTQKQADLPEGFSVPEGRIKPWGTAHAIMTCRNLIDGPFAVVNADDFYGPKSYKLIHDFLVNTDGNNFAMVSYLLKNTVTDNGHVSRGICSVSKDGMLKRVVERSRIEKVNGGIAFTLDDGKNWEMLDEDTQVSMNLWGYTEGMMKELVARFPAFLREAQKGDMTKAEYMIPSITDDLVREGLASVAVLNSDEKWYGVTYQDDKLTVSQALKSLKAQGIYPEKLWE